MNRLHFLLIILLSTVVASNYVYAQTKSILGPGASTCGLWIEDRKTQTYPVQLSWVLGFISAHNHYMKLNVFGNTDALAIAGWIDNYCTKRPLDTLYESSINLVDELKSRKR